MGPKLKATKDFFVNIDMEYIYPVQAEEKVSLDRFARNIWLKEALNTDSGHSILDQLAALKAYDPAFEYKVFTDNENQLPGFIFTTKEGKKTLAQFGGVIFL